MSWTFIFFLFLLLILFFTARAAVIGAPWVPSRRAVVERVWRDLGIDADDTVVDLGAGSGTALVAAAKRGAKTIGWELSPIMWLIAHVRSLFTPHMTVRWGNFFAARLPKKTTVIFMFMMPNTLPKVVRYLAEQALSPQCRVVSYAFMLPGLAPRHVTTIAGVGVAYVYYLEDLGVASEDAGVAAVADARLATSGLTQSQDVSY